MDKMRIIKSVTDVHDEITEQLAVVNGFLKVFNTRGVLFDLEGIIKFFNVSMARHFLKENIIFKALLNAPGVEGELADTIKDTINEHDKFMEEFRQLVAIAEEMEKGEGELSIDFIKKCQYIIWALSKHAQIEDLVIFQEVADKLGDQNFEMIEDELMKI